MTIEPLVQTDPFEVWKRVVQEEFQKAPSFTRSAIWIGAFVAVIALAYWYDRRRKVAVSGHEKRDPTGLFHNFQEILKLPKEMKHLLDVAAKDGNLKNPAVLFLSPFLFDRYVTQQQSQEGSPNLNRLRQRLFPALPANPQKEV